MLRFHEDVSSIIQHSPTLIKSYLIIRFITSYNFIVTFVKYYTPYGLHDFYRMFKKLKRPTFCQIKEKLHTGRNWEPLEKRCFDILLNIHKRYLKRMIWKTSYKGMWTEWKDDFFSLFKSNWECWLHSLFEDFRVIQYKW